MSELPTCLLPQTDIQVQPCTQDQQGNLICGTIGDNQTGFLLQNMADEAIVASSMGVDPPLCFTIDEPMQAPDETQKTFQSYGYIINRPAPITFLLQGATSGTAYGTVTTTVGPMPSRPTPIAQDVQPIVQPKLLPSGWQYADIRKNKPVWMLILGGGLVVVMGILLIVAGAQKNKQVFRLYAELKGAKSDRELEVLDEDDSLEEEYSKFRSTGLIVVGVIIILIVIALTVAMMFLPGFPLSKYLSYSQCQAIAASDPGGQWSWSIPPESGFYSFVCKALGACICRSYKNERLCLLYRITDTNYAPQPWRSALKKTTFSRTCSCCFNNQCGEALNDGSLRACTN